jgi:tetratricopeptide (TPR) repeat protein
MCISIKGSIYMNKFKYIVFVSLLLAACAQAPRQQEVANQAEQPDQSEQSDQSIQQAETPKALPNIELSSDLLYQFLLSEIASQRGQSAIAVDGSLDLAKKTRDPRLAMRATHIALQSGEVDKAVEAIKVWRETDPDSLMARRMMSSVLLRSGKLDEANAEFSSLLKVDEGHVAQNFIQLYQMLSSYPDRAAALKLMRNLALPYPRVAEAHFGVAQLAQALDDETLALSEVKQACDLRPEWDMAVSLEAQLLQKSAPQQGVDLLRNFLSRYPDAREIRLQYARALLDQKQYKPARDEFQRMAKENPDNPDLAYAIALISLQLNDLQNAEKQLKEALEKGKKDQDTIQFYLGQLSEAKKNEEDAIAYYRAVKDGEYLFAAQVRAAYLLSKRGQLAEARQQLQQVQPADNQQRVQLGLAEAQLLRDAGQFDEAYKILNQVLENHPDQTDLLYETAMIADKLGKPEVFEKLMRKIIQIKPDHAQAYNALGYGLLERNERIPEAMQLVEKALQLAPNDAAIMDSMGWGYYRSGKLDDSVKMLRRAFEGNPDPEIAAHLGEVLWVRGDKDEAKKIWQNSLKANPGNAPLQAAIKKFDP